jgi:hypothetical protein
VFLGANVSQKITLACGNATRSLLGKKLVRFVTKKVKNAIERKKRGDLEV